MTFKKVLLLYIKTYIILIRTFKNGSNVVLLVLKLLNAYSHWIINDAFER
jgi:hypothetical protein